MPNKTTANYEAAFKALVGYLKRERVRATEAYKAWGSDATRWHAHEMNKIYSSGRFVSREHGIDWEAL